MNRKILCNIALISTLLLSKLLSSTSVQAQSAVELAVTPPTAYMKVKQGSSATHTVIIENLSSQPLQVKPKVVDFTSDGATGVPVLATTTTFPYFEIDQQSLEPISLPPKGKAELALKMTVPLGVPNQEFPMTILFESEPDTSFSLAAGTTAVRSTIGSNFIVLVSSESDVNTSLAVTSFKTSGIVDSFRPLTFTPVVSNTSYAATTASGSAQVVDWHGATVAEFTIRPVIILGNSSRELETTISDTAYTSLFKYKPFFLLGLYKINLDLTIQSNDDSFHLLQTKTIIALPISLILAALLLTLTWVGYKYYSHTKV
jgi:hypothetical protein